MFVEIIALEAVIKQDNIKYSDFFPHLTYAKHMDIHETSTDTGCAQPL